MDCPPIVNPSPVPSYHPPFPPPQFQPLFCTNRAARPPLPLTQWCFCRHLSILETERQNPKFHGNYEILCCQGPCLHHNQQLLFYKREPKHIRIISGGTKKMGKMLKMKWCATVFEFLSVACRAVTSSIKTEDRENHVTSMLYLYLYIYLYLNLYLYLYLYLYFSCIWICICIFVCVLRV